MVDKERRKKLALHLRHLSVGLISNDDFEAAIMDDVSNGWLPEQYYRSKLAKSEDDDPIIKPMLELCWGLYSDLENYKLVKSHALPSDVMKIIARCILFLQSDKEYEWPYFNKSPLREFSLTDIILSILTLGLHIRSKWDEQEISYYE